MRFTAVRATLAAHSRREGVGMAGNRGNRLRIAIWVLPGVQTAFLTFAADPATVIAEMTYDHPIFTVAAVEAARRLRSAGGERLAFAGAHLGWGFHEDGCRSGVEAAARLGASW